MSDDIETRVNDLEKKTLTIEMKVDAFIAEMRRSNDDFKAEMRDFKTEMRDRDNQRAAEILALQTKQDNDIKELRKETNAQLVELRKVQVEQQKQHAADMQAMREEMKGISKEVHNMFLTSAAGIAAIVITVIASMVFTAVQLNKQTSLPAPSPAIHTQLELPLDRSKEVNE